MKSKDFLRSKGILSNDSDHYIIDFHDGREINLGDLLEEYAQQSQPSGMRWVRASERLPDTLDEVIVRTMIGGKKVAMYARREHMGKESKMLLIVNGNHISTLACEWLDEYSPASNDYKLDNGLGTTTVFSSSPAGAAEGASEGMAEALRFAKWLADNDYRPGSGNKHWFKWNGMEVDENPLTIEQCYQIFASLSPGVEDGSGWVKVEDGLPEMVEGWSRVEYMTIIKGYTGVWVGKIFKSSFGYSCTAKTSHDIITHWQPLPTPPGVEDNQTKKQ